VSIEKTRGPKAKVFARLVIHDAAEMGYKGRDQLAWWLISQAMALRVDGEDFARVVRIRYINVEKEKK
jgi:hypothetical protein